MIHVAIAFMLVPLVALGTLHAQPRATPEAIIVGDWQLNLARTHYGPGVEPRLSERFSCVAEAERVRCVIRSARADGRTLTASFTAPVDGTRAAVTGIPDIDEVQLRRPNPGLIDATFLSQGKPALGYRAFRSQDGRSLMMVAVDPVTRAALTTVVVYDRR